MKRRFCLFLFLLAFLFLGAFSGCVAEKAQSSFSTAQLEQYVIIYEESNPDYLDLALSLSDHLFAQYGHMLQVLPDTVTPPSQYEILLGDTNRYEPLGKIMEYAVSIEEGKFRIHAGGSFSGDKAVDFLCQNVFDGQELTLTQGEYYQKSLLSQAYPVTQGASARIMTANILADSFADGSYRQAHYRAEILAGVLMTYTPDVVGLQEADRSWDQVLDTYLAKLERTCGISYSRHLATCEGMVNYTGFLYRSDKFQVQSSGVTPFTWWTDGAFSHDYHMRNISWAAFTAIEPGSQPFLVANTHWSYRTEHANGKTYLSGSASPITENQLRLQCKNETNRFLQQLRQTHPGMPVFLTGDFNTSLSFFTQSDWTPSGFQLLSEEADRKAVATAKVPDSGHFDHIFAAGSYQIAEYGFFHDGHMALLTDHPFVYADLIF